jgi:HSP20 family protein
MAYITRQAQPRSLATNRDVLDRWMESAFGTPWWSGFWANENQPAGNSHGFPVDIYENGDSYVVMAALPGVNPDEVQVTALSGTLTIAAEVKPSIGEGFAPLYREMAYGQFRRDVRLPGDFALDQAEATYNGGMLRLNLPKAEHLKPKSLRVKVTKP